MTAERAEPPPRKVLVIDDEAAVRFAVEVALRQSGWSVAAAECGEAALDIFQPSPGSFDAVLLDMTLPTLSSEQTLEALRSLRDDIPVILSSGLDRETLEQRLETMNACGFLPKPFRPAELVECLNQAVQQRGGT